MAANLPAKLKTADITRFAHRAAQLETAKPVIAYWCEYHVLNTILAKGLHNADPECRQYTVALMEKLEKLKEDPSIETDDASGQAAVLQFGLQTFERADRAVQADKVTKQTADTFQAAATFLDVLKVFGEVDPEIQAKSKYAKWNAVRIAKAIKEGKDPNESNPKSEPQEKSAEDEQSAPPLDPNDPEVQMIMGVDTSHRASVEEVPDEEDQVEKRLAATSVIDQSLHPSQQPSEQPSEQGSPRIAPETEKFDPFPRDAFPYTAIPKEGDASAEESPRDRSTSIGGGYFPEVPTFTAEARDPTLTTAPSDDITLPDAATAPQIPSPRAQDFYSQPSAPPAQPAAPVQPSAPAHIFAPQAFNAQPSAAPIQYAPGPISVPAKEEYITDDAAIAKAQKHARWAISALNFEDVDTAVKQLRDALQTLGARV